MTNFKVTIVGAGLAGSEAACVLSSYDFIDVKLIEMRPKITTEVHKTSNCAELVCSNSFKSLKYNSASGMLKYELASLASPLFEIALKNQVDAGNALAVDRILFSKDVTNKISKQCNINFVHDEFVDIEGELKNCDKLILATGPLTSEKLSSSLSKITGQDHLAFYDAAAPIVLTDSLNFDYIFKQDRYNTESSGDYLNIALTKEQYENLINNLLDAECVIKKDFETKDLFQACQPIEEVARSGFDAPRYGALKPVGITDPNTQKRPWAVVQLRAENAQKSAYNLVGFQTNLTFSEQKRVFSLIPGLDNAEYARYGVMHRNTFINSPMLLNRSLNFRKLENLYVAGQLMGTEGYLEAIRSGHHVALNVLMNLLNKSYLELPSETVFGALLDYATNTYTKNYQPMHVNFGILSPLEKKVRNKKERYNLYANRAKLAFDTYIKNLYEVQLFDDDKLQHSTLLKNKLEDLWVKI